MGHHSCCNQQKVKRGLWSPEEDEKLIRYITTHGYGSWSEVPEKVGLHLHLSQLFDLHFFCFFSPYFWSSKMRQKWAHIASHLPGRTNNEIKNYWNSWIKKKIRKTSAPPTSIAPSTTTDHSRITYASNQLDLVNQGIPNQQETLFSSPAPALAPLFMFDTTNTLDRFQVHQHGTNNVRGELFNDATNLNTESSWNLNQHQVQAFPPSTCFTVAVDMDSNNNLPALVENMENMAVPIEVQSCSMEEEGEMTLECLQLQRQQQELNEWVESQQCSNFLFWDNIHGQLTGETLPPTSLNMTAATLSSFPTSL
ncbi:hypothetical protein V6N11_070923 [Hibiscus sabdariffa]|uniref:Uncharacterized protein n=2 Tax=Hibiscus sabdariffa TaxID=183260 RepID=A0ABR2D9G3_9ROSI